MSERERQKEVYVSHDLTPPAPFFTFYFRSESSVVQFRYTPHYVRSQRIRNTDDDSIYIALLLPTV